MSGTIEPQRLGKLPHHLPHSIRCVLNPTNVPNFTIPTVLRHCNGN